MQVINYLFEYGQLVVGENKQKLYNIKYQRPDRGFAHVFFRSRKYYLHLFFVHYRVSPPCNW